MDVKYGLEKSINLSFFPKESNESIKFMMNILLSTIYPLLQRISVKLQQSYKSEPTDENSLQIRNVYTLCSDQIRKCYLTLIEIIKLEFNNDICLQESRQCIFERLSCCYEKLQSIEQLLVRDDGTHSFNNSLTEPPMYFVEWIDQTFDILNKLSKAVYQNSPKQCEEKHHQWKLELIECVQGLHTSIDELLLSSMTLCKYCLPDDQLVVKARCQVVLRETKALLSDLIDGDLETVKPTVDNLRLPIMPSNINLLIIVLKDVLYVLEKNINTALLVLVIHCFGQSLSPTEKLKNHFERNSKDEKDVCHGADLENCEFIKEFDLHNERLLQIGYFAMSCTSHPKRLLCLRSGLASLEALDPHLVPSMMLSPTSHNSTLLMDTWNQEVKQIMESVFLIVDPAPFANKARLMMHNILLEIIKENKYDNSKTCAVINTGCLVYDFFNVYQSLDPDALVCKEQLESLLKDLNKVQKECKVVSNMFCSTNDHKYDLKTNKETNISIKQLIKRLKLLYTLVKRINVLLNPKVNDEFCEEEIENKNITQTINYTNGNTYVNSPRKQANNFTRSIFARTNIRSSTGKFPLAILTKNLKSKHLKELSFSVRFDEMCNLSEIKAKNRELSNLYSPMKTRSSLRKALLSRLVTTPSKKQDELTFARDNESYIDDSLQITDVLNQINELTNNISMRGCSLNSTVVIDEPLKNNDVTKNILKLTVNNDSIIKNIWNISMNSTNNESACNTNVTQPSDFNTLERINDLDLVESKLSDLKSGHFETSL